VPFPGSRKFPMLARRVPSRLGHGSPRVQPVAPADPAGDAEINTEWDLLIRLATKAWAGHDPKSLDVLEQTVVRLRAWIGRDLSTRCRAAPRSGAPAQEVADAMQAGCDPAL
jgi:hypothetical protein